MIRHQIRAALFDLDGVVVFTDKYHYLAWKRLAKELFKPDGGSIAVIAPSTLAYNGDSAVLAQAFFSAVFTEGKSRLGDAMLEGQRELKDDTFRGRIFGAGELRLEDWFVPVLFQEKDDPQLFRRTPAPQTQEDLRTILASRTI